MGFSLEQFFEELLILLNAAKKDACTIEEIIQEVEGNKRYAKECGLIK